MIFRNGLLAVVFGAMTVAHRWNTRLARKVFSSALAEALNALVTLLHRLKSFVFSNMSILSFLLTISKDKKVQIRYFF